jgi:hypothetical protein
VEWRHIFIYCVYRISSILFGGVTISKAAFLNQNKSLSLDDKNQWQDVQILVIDKISFMSNSILQTLDRKLNEIGNRTLAFGGFSIIFSGDFRQLKPVGSNEKELMFSSLSSGHWDKSINVVIILNNEYCFKEDPEYGKMLTRMWSGDLSKEDCQKLTLG